MTLLRLDAITIGDRFRKDLGDMDALVASIESVGLLHPIVVMADDASHVTLVAGERRLRACERLGWERIPVRMLPAGVDLLRAERDENEVREPFTPSEAVAIAAALRPAVEADARQRQGTRTDVTGEPPANVARSRDVIAAAVGMGRTTLARATEVVEAATANPTLAPLVEAMDDTGRVAPVHAALQALPPDPTPEVVAEVATAVRERRKPTDLPMTDAHRALFPRAAASELTADLHTAMGHVRTEKCAPSAWADRIERMRPEDIEDMRAKVARVRRWADEWDALLAPRPLSIVGGTK